MKALILAGGSGTRLWPLSRKRFPKQFLMLNCQESLLQQTVGRLLKVLTMDDIIVMTNSEYKFYVKADLEKLANLILEPAARNTAPAIALGVKYCSERLGCGEDEVLFVSPADHVIRPDDAFARCVGLAEKIAREGHIVTFGIKPLSPETGYGYIRADAEPLRPGSECYRVARFEEKPDAVTAAKYVSNGGYYWNSGMFAFTIGTISEELRKHSPAIGAMLEMNFDEMVSKFVEMPDISIDYALMEKSDRVVTLPVDLYWNDIGSWDSLYDVLDKDKDGNVAKGDILMIDTKGTLVLGNKRLISTIGLEDCIIVETDDAILIAKKGDAQKVKDVVDSLRKEMRPEAEEHVTTHRPWGSYTILEEGPRYKIKRIVVRPGEKLSLQMHYHRSEHWVVVRGTAQVTIGDRTVVVHENESAFVPKSTIHRLENPGRVPLEIIEVQNGEYLGEDDIVRHEDVYDRHQ